MNPVALYRFFDAFLPMCHSVCFNSNREKKWQRPLFQILFRFNDFLKALRLSRNTRGSLLFTIISMTKKMHYLELEIMFDTCTCCGRRMQITCGRRYIEKHCSGDPSSTACAAEDYGKCTDPDRQCLIRAPTTEFAMKNATIVNIIASLLLMNVDIHDGTFINLDPDCEHAVGILLYLLDYLVYYNSDDGKSWFVCPQRSLDKWWKIKLENGHFYTFRRTTEDDIVSMMRGMPGMSHFIFSIPPFLTSRFSMSKKKIIKMTGKSVHQAAMRDEHLAMQKSRGLP